MVWQLLRRRVEQPGVLPPAQRCSRSLQVNDRHHHRRHHHHRHAVLQSSSKSQGRLRPGLLRLNPHEVFRGQADALVTRHMRRSRQRPHMLLRSNVQATPPPPPPPLFYLHFSS